MYSLPVRTTQAAMSFAVAAPAAFCCHITFFIIFGVYRILLTLWTLSYL